jgi:hypothetical protein
VCIMYRVIRLIFLSNISFFASLFGQIWNKTNPKKKKRVAAHPPSFLFRVLKILQIFQTSSRRVREKRKRKSHVLLSSTSSRSFLYLSLVVVSSNARSWEDKGNQTTK